MDFKKVADVDGIEYEYDPYFAVFFSLLNEDKFYIYTLYSKDDITAPDVIKVSEDVFKAEIDAATEPAVIFVEDLSDMIEKIVFIRTEALKSIKPISETLGVSDIKIPKYIREMK